MRRLTNGLKLAVTGLVVACGESPTQPDVDRPDFGVSAQPVLVLTGQAVAGAPEAEPTGVIRLRCLKKGTLIVGRFSGLLPDAVYTLWLFTTTAAGAAGPATGDQNVFQASASGRGRLILLVKPEDAGSFSGANWPACIDASNLRSPQPALIVDGHTDGEAHGPVPFPNNYSVLRFFTT